MSQVQAPILAVDDNPESLFTVEQILSTHGYQVVTAGSGEEALKTASEVTPSVILLDVVMPRMSGYAVTERLKADAELRFVPIILITAKNTLEDVIEGLDRGADDYITKPYRPEELLARLRAAERLHELYDELRRSEEQKQHLLNVLTDRYDFSQIIGQSAAMQELFATLRQISDVELPVLITGPTGSGKELIARALHYNSRRREAPFVAQNCAAFHENLLESDFFGHVRGAFTGAFRDKKGIFEAANGGTLFLDEVAEMSPSLQAKLLRVIQEGVLIPVGSTEERRVDVRLLVATNRNLEELVALGRFREDLFYRLNALTVQLPALRERADDIPLLVEYFIARECKRMEVGTKQISSAALDLLVRYSWRGNIRELENEVARMVALSRGDDELGVAVISPRIRAEVEQGVPREDLTASGKLYTARAALERELIARTLARLNGNRSAAAKELGMSRGSLIEKIKRYSLR